MTFCLSAKILVQVAPEVWKKVRHLAGRLIKIKVFALAATKRGILLATDLDNVEVTKMVPSPLPFYCSHRGI